MEAKHGKLERLADVDLSPKTMITMQVKWEENIEQMAINTKHTIGKLICAYI